MIQQLKTANENCDYELIRSTLRAAVSGYKPECGVVDKVTMVKKINYPMLFKCKNFKAVTYFLMSNALTFYNPCEG